MVCIRLAVLLHFSFNIYYIFQKITFFAHWRRVVDVRVASDWLKICLHVMTWGYLRNQLKWVKGSVGWTSYCRAERSYWSSNVFGTGKLRETSFLKAEHFTDMWNLNCPYGLVTITWTHRKKSAWFKIAVKIFTIYTAASILNMCCCTVCAFGANSFLIKLSQTSGFLRSDGKSCSLYHRHSFFPTWELHPAAFHLTGFPPPQHPDRPRQEPDWSTNTGRRVNAGRCIERKQGGGKVKGGRVQLELT